MEEVPNYLPCCSLEHGVVIETPAFGHAAYVFAKPKSMAMFLADYARTAKEGDRNTEWISFAAHVRLTSAIWS